MTLFTSFIPINVTDLQLFLQCTKLSADGFFFPVRYVSMAVPDDGFVKRPKHVPRFGQLKLLCGNTAVIDGSSVCLLHK